MNCLIHSNLPIHILTSIHSSTENLNGCQQEAVRFALSQPDLAVIHGPPGTGKTTTLVEIIYQHVREGNRVLAVAPSNSAVDNLAVKLHGVGLNVLRLGQMARISDRVKSLTLDEKVER